MIYEFLKAFSLIFIAEIGDKTQILLMACAAKYTIMQVLTGIFIGVALNHGLAIAIGMYLSNIIEGEMIHVCAGAIFIVFGLYSFREDTAEKQKKMFGCGPVFAVAGTFFLGELGDKTQLTALTVAMDSDNPFLVLSGSIAAMISVGLIGIMVGTALTKKVPSYIIKIISGTVFIIFGLIKIFSLSDLFVCNPMNQGIILTGIFLISIYLIQKLLMNR